MTPEDCVEAVAQRFPDMAAREATELDHGWSFHTFRLGDAVWRFPRTENDARLLERESRLLPTIARYVTAPIAVPEWMGSWQGRAFAGYRYIDGEPLTPSLLQAPRIQSQLGRFLTELHGIPVRELAPHIAEATTAAGWKKRHRDLLSAIEVRTDGLLAPSMIRTVRRRMTVAIDRFEFGPVIAHADLGYNAALEILDHLLVADAELVGVLDFSDMAIGDPAIDFSGFLAAAGWDAVEGVAANYLGELGERFRERVAFHFWVAPLHDIVYGLDIHDADLVGENVVELDRRLEVTGTVT